MQHQIDLKINLVAHWKYLPVIAIINKGLLNKKLLLSIIVVLRQNFLNTSIKIAILGKIYQIYLAVVTQNQSSIGLNVYVSKAALLSTFLTTKKMVLSISISGFSQKFPDCSLLYFWR